MYISKGCFWSLSHLIFICLKLRSWDVCRGSGGVKEGFLFAMPGLQFFDLFVCGSCFVGSDELSVFCLPSSPLSAFSPQLTVANVPPPLLFFPLWTQCTTSCGPGYQMRAVKCVVGSYGAVMDDTECNAATRPTDTQVRRALSSFLPCFFSPYL